MAVPPSGQTATIEQQPHPSFYQNHLQTSLAYRAMEHIRLPEAIFGKNADDNIVVQHLKNAGFRTSAVALAFFASIEWIVRESIAFVALAFSLATWPFSKWASLSDRSYQLSTEMAHNNKKTAQVVNRGLHKGLFDGINSVPVRSVQQAESSSS